MATENSDRTWRPEVWQAAEELGTTTSAVVSGLAGAVTTLPIALWLVDRSLRVVWRWGEPPEPTDGERAAAAHREVLATGRAVRYRSGPDARFACSIGPLHDATGAVVGVTGACVDYTAEVTARAQLAASEERFRLFMHYSPAPALLKDVDLNFVWANPAYFRTYRIDPDRWQGSTAGDHVDRRRAEEIESLDRATLESNQPIHSTGTITRPDGTTGQDSGWRFPITLSDGTRYLGATFIDTTDEKFANERAVLAETRWRDLFEHGGMAVGLFRPDGTAIEANSEFCRLFGYRPSELPGTPVDVFWQPADAAKERPRWAALVGGGAHRYRSRLVGRRRDGSPVLAQATASLVREPGGEPGTVYLVVEPLLGADDPTQPGAQPMTAGGAAGVLTPEQTRLLELLAAGHTQAVIARRLRVAIRTVEHRLTRLRAQLGLSSTTNAGLVAHAYATGLLLHGTWPPRAAAPTED